MENSNISLYKKDRNIIILSPFIIILINIIVALSFGKLIGKWAFIPVILIEWCIFSFLIFRYGGINSVKNWLKKPQGGIGWTILALSTGLICLPIFIFNKHLLTVWTIWLPWIALAVINPWLEEFYWRGLLSDYTNNWNKWLSIFYTSVVFSANHAVFGLNSNMLRGPELVTSTLIMGIIWAIVYKKTGSLRWAIFAHFMVDFLSLSAPAFLDLLNMGRR
ncbi:MULTISPECIES: CPBP family intramembrane glutamic endopeptidase [Dysgonomonas]|jgi:membrane protease YdiL (CAAX protease family)|uniref:CAAX prenyl protease 2/Lysostaphin resistance protein A-like domain-containing protein n=1 Tax=Dysgonomonas gadei ATCC BAA-286 TaxID=742766 RepID=F5J086_9BACT|nr:MULTISPECIES: CPBP family intramembrane glutamic endopeptidase [Dysgonomonas]EGK00964.1 hypothetical protein HMPREF9455_02753 [Dysgonomonas gadei ATCC BAA-286]MBF0650620.1 CPBP family intramembrane metalloprotease [Dysgonomonas sp. GY75]